MGLAIETGSITSFGLDGYKLGVFLICTNLVILVLSFYFAWNSYQRKLVARQKLDWMVCMYFLFLKKLCDFLSFFIVS
jgi:hypothetical protein